MASTFPIRANTQPAIKDIDSLINALRKTGKEAGMSEKEINDMVNAAKKAGTEGAPAVGKINKEVGTLTASLRNVASGFAAMIAVDKLVEIATKVVTVRAEFEKLEAVLSNTLGSNSRAQDALRMIQDIAAKTPFSVLQLTQSYVKLVNQGFKPTNAEIIKLGDLAASTGKDIDQLTEALIDAQVGEFERLKDFGIRASKEGDKVTFSFKGVEQQTDFTNDAIREYILSLGDLTGVKGSMIVVSETLGGKINNLGDSLDKLANLTGSALSPALGSAIDHMNNMIAILTDENLTKFQKFAAIFGGNADQRASLAAVLNKQRELQNAERERAIEGTVNAALASGNVEAYIKALDQNIYKEEIIARIRETQAKEQKKNDEEAAKAKAKLIEQLDKEIANWKSAAQRGQEYREEMAQLYRMLSEINQPKLNALSDSVNKTIAGVGKKGPTNPFDLPLINNPDYDPDGKTFIENEMTKQELMQQSYDLAVRLSNDLLNIQQNNYTQELNAARFRYESELGLLGNNEEAKDKLTRDYMKKQYELQNKQNQLASEQALFQILSSQGPAIAKTLAAGNGAFTLPLALSLLGFFASIISSQRKIQPPRYAADGEYGINGPGTTKSDSIPYFLSREESVVQAERSNKFKALLKPLIESDRFDWADVRSIVDKRLPGSPARPIILAQSPLDDSAIQRLGDRLVKSIESKKETRFTFDEHGFGLWMGKGQDWTKYVKGRYSM